MTKPHIVLVMTDQQRFDTIAATGHPYMKTPNLDRLVREGIYFDNCFINAPSCVPSRAALFSGLYPHASGVLKNRATLAEDLGQQSGGSRLSLRQCRQDAHDPL
ncbi:arylsulfatase A-like enzyme [Bradyrhizobium sp. LB1.3]